MSKILRSVFLNHQIFIQVNGVDVVGEFVDLQPRQMKVRMLSPVTSSNTRGLHRSTFAASAHGGFVNKHDNITNDGHRISQELLEALYNEHC